jgi:ribosome maturation factor RimP
LENFSYKNLFEALSQKFSEIFPVNDIHLISINVTSRKAVIVTIMKKGGITLDDCKYVSSIITSFIPDDYDLQVQSPGIGFEIRKDSFNLLDLFLQTPVKIFYNKIIEDKEIVKEEEGILTFIDKSISIKKFEKNKKNKKKLKKINDIDNAIKELKNSNLNNNFDESTDQNIISIPLDKIIKVKTTFYPEEI